MNVRIYECTNLRIYDLKGFRGLSWLSWSKFLLDEQRLRPHASDLLAAPLAVARKGDKMMSDKRIEDYTPDEFEAVLNAFIEREIEDVPMDDFFAALAEIDRRRRQEVIQVQGRIVQGQLIFSLPCFAPPTVAVEGHQIILDRIHRIVVTLEPTTA
jgi:hypothetical protein